MNRTIPKRMAARQDRRRRRARIALGLVWWTLLAAGPAHAHEIRPALLQITWQQSTGDTATYQVVWKQPILGNRRLPLEPVLPAPCHALGARQPEVQAAALVERWSVRCSPGALTGTTVRVDGLSRTLTDVLVHINLAGGREIRALLKPNAASLTIGDGSADDPGTLEYLQLGVEHLLFGIDHILFVLGLLLLIDGTGRLIKTITAFTVAHSITLALSALDVVRVPQAPVEAVIALSIVFLASEILRDDPSAPSRRSPWLIALLFGLLHGFGFAGALADIGLPGDTALWALFLFNIGLEIGQLAVVAVALGLAWSLARLDWKIPPPLARAPAYALGIVASYWLLDRIVQLG